MADDISVAAVGSDALFFPLMPNWANKPSLKYVLARDYVQFPGSAQLLGSTTERTPYEFTLNFQVSDKQSEYELLDFIHTVKGKAKRFWIEHPVHLFDLAATLPSGASSITVSGNEFNKIGQNDERIFIALKTGDLIVRAITNNVLDGSNVVLTLNEVVQTEVTTDDYWLIGRYLLCRMSNDNFRQKMESQNVTTYTIGFTELPYENDEQGDIT